MKVSCAIVFLLLFLPAIGSKADLMALPKTATENNWQQALDKEGIKVFTRPREGSCIKEYRGVVKVDASASQLVAILKDNAIAPQWMYHTKKCELVRGISDMEWENYYQYSFPFPVSNRDMAVKFSMIQGADKKVSLHMVSVPDIVEQKDGFTRVMHAEGGITLTPQGDGKTEVAYTFFVNPAGYIPVFLINTFITESPYNTLSHLRELLKTGIHKDIKYAYIKD